MDRNELKVQALIEKISSLTSMYESQAADYRVEITILNSELESLRSSLSPGGEGPETVAGEVVEEGQRA